MSKKKLISIALLFCSFFLCHNLLAQNQESTSEIKSEKFYSTKFGAEIRGKNAFTAAIGTVVPNGDFMNPLWEIYFHAGYKRYVSPHLNINFMYHKFNIAYKDLFNNGFMSFDLNLEANIMPYDTFTPFVYAGVGMNAANHFITKDFKAQAGVGLEYLVTEKVGLKLVTDYNQVFSDDHLDSKIFGDSDDVYWRMSLGLNVYFGSRLKTNKIAEDVPTVIETNPIVDDY